MKPLIRVSSPTDGGMQANFAKEQSGGATETEGVRKLKQICAELPSRPGAVKDLLAALQDEGPDKISTYEFLSSGAVSELRKYLQGKSAPLILEIRIKAASLLLSAQYPAMGPMEIHEKRGGCWSMQQPHLDGTLGCLRLSSKQH